MYVIASKRLCTSFRCVCTLPRALPAVGLRRVCSEAGPSSEERKIKLDRTGMPLSERRRREARQRAFLQELPTPTSVSMRPIGIVRTPYTLRHDCPRQPMMPAAPGAAEPQEALATIELYEGLGLEASVRDPKNGHVTCTYPRARGLYKGEMRLRNPVHPGLGRQGQ